MSEPWWWICPALVCAGLAGAAGATALWWWLAPQRLTARWNTPLRQALEAGFADQSLQQRLRTQGDGVWIRRQQAQWMLAQEKLFSRQEARLLAQVSVLVRPRAAPLPLETLLTDDQLDALPPELAGPVGDDAPRLRAAASRRKQPLPMTSI